MYVCVYCVYVAYELKAIISIREREQRANLMLRDAKLQLAEMDETKELLGVKLEVS